MPDLSFRDELYGRYVSTFKASDYSKLDGKALRSYFAWCDYKYLPLLEGCDRRVPVLELGCGGGLTMDYLKRVGFTSVEGIDISQEQIEVARGRGLDVTATDVFEYVDPRQETYGAIVALDFIEHFTKDEVLRLLTSAYRALKDGGTLLLQTPNGQGLFPGQVIYGDFTHLTVLTPDSLTQVLRLTGFANIRLLETGPMPAGWKGKARVALWRGIKRAANTVRLIETGKTQEIWTENIVCAARKVTG